MELIKQDNTEKLAHGNKAGYAKTCIDCKKVPEGEFCTDRCMGQRQRQAKAVIKELE